MSKYKNLEQLKAAYESGELSRQHPLMLDNDSAAVYVDGKCVFHSDEPPEAEVLEQALKLLGIPFDDV